MAVPVFSYLICPICPSKYLHTGPLPHWVVAYSIRSYPIHSTMFRHVSCLTLAILALPCVILFWTFSHLNLFLLQYLVVSFLSPFLILSELSCPGLSLCDLLVFPFILSYLYTQNATPCCTWHRTNPMPVWYGYISLGGGMWGRGVLAQLDHVFLHTSKLERV